MVTPDEPWPAFGVTTSPDGILAWDSDGAWPLWCATLLSGGQTESARNKRRQAVFERILLGVGRRMVPVPEWLLATMARRDAKKLAKVSKLEPDERRVQHFAVREIPRRRVAIAPAVLAAELDLPLNEVRLILDELERRMTFLCRRGGEGSPATH